VPIAERRIGSTARALVLVPVLPRLRRPTVVTPAGDGEPKAIPPLHSPQDRLAEAIGLANAIDLDVAEGVTVPVPNPRPSTLFGSGKVEEMAKRVAQDGIELIVIDHTVTPIQQRNLEKAWNTKVLDRTGLILEIFGRRAQTREGRLQVELAHLTYQKSRLVRSWTHLERQRGGAGFLGGPGESQLELDRRLIQDRIDGIRVDLAQVVKTRELHRRGRRKVPYPIVAIVGYTNAGKSTLFNRVTGAAVLAKDQVFATLDPTMREVKLSGGRRIILSDTVGFISDLPTMLVAAFRATLEEVIEADLILHVRDIAHPESDAQSADVEGVLRDLGIDPHVADSRLIEVWNKVDLLDGAALDLALGAAARANHRPALVSAVIGQGIDDLLRLIDDRFSAHDDTVCLNIPAADGAILAWLHENAEIVESTCDDDGATHVTVRIERSRHGRLLGRMKGTGVRVEG
jgi:GTPase